MNKKLKVMFIAAGLFAAFATGAYAESYLQTISAYLNKGVTLSWNGVPFYPTETDGSRVYPITYKGRTYIPAKFVAEKAGLNVDWEPNTMTVSISDNTYVKPQIKQGTYRKIGNGTLKLLTDNFEEVTKVGYDVEEKLALNEYDTYKTTIKSTFEDRAVRKRVHIKFVEKIKEEVKKNEWKLLSSVNLGGEHYKHIYEHCIQPLKMEVYSTDDEVVFLAYMSENKSTSNTISNAEYFPGYFSSIPKPRSYNKEKSDPLQDYSVGYKKSYVLESVFFVDKNKINSIFYEYQEQLKKLGYSLYKIKDNEYTYTKGDIAVEILKSSDTLIFKLSSGYQAPHIM